MGSLTIYQVVRNVLLTPKSRRYRPADGTGEALSVLKQARQLGNTCWPRTVLPQCVYRGPTATDTDTGHGYQPDSYRSETRDKCSFTASVCRFYVNVSRVSAIFNFFFQLHTDLPPWFSLFPVSLDTGRLSS